MEPEARYTMIGSVLLAIVVALVAGFVWLSSSGRASDFRFYTIYFERQSLEGLQVGGDVNMRGVKVGRIENFTISRDNINKVKVTIRVARATPVSENTTAVVARSIVTGLARINLDTPGTPGPELMTVAVGERYPVITEGTIGNVLAQMIVYDAATTQGGSGGPVFGSDGEVIAVNYAVLRDFTGANFGVPIVFGIDLIKP